MTGMTAFMHAIIIFKKIFEVAWDQAPQSGTTVFRLSFKNTTAQKSLSLSRFLSFKGSKVTDQKGRL